MNTEFPVTVAITGASRGLGAALALEYAEPGRLLALSARSIKELREVARICRERGADVLWTQVDISDKTQIKKWIDEIEQTAPLELMIANAGIFSGRTKDGPLESLDTQLRQIDINLAGAMATAHFTAQVMRKRRSGHIALISSLAALQPMADAPAYSASKAGLRAYGEALNEALMDDNIIVSTVLPGHIITEQTAVHAGPTPGIISARKAAHIICKNLERKPTYIAFPAKAHWLVRIGRFLSWRSRARINRPQRFHVKENSDQQ